MEYYFDAFKKYVQFEGRTSRKAFWMFVLFNALVSIIISIIDNAFHLEYNEQGLLGNIYSLAVFLPSLAIGVRRLHDGNRNGWWVICPIVNLIFFLMPGTPGPNKYGPAPEHVENKPADI